MSDTQARKEVIYGPLRVCVSVCVKVREGARDKEGNSPNLT